MWQVISMENKRAIGLSPIMYLTHFMYTVHLHTIPCCKVTMDILLSGKIFHTLSDLMTHSKILLSSHLHLQKSYLSKTDTLIAMKAVS